MIKLLKSIFKIMWFLAKAAWFCIFFFIFYNLLRDQIEEYIKEYRKKKASQKTAEETAEKKGKTPLFEDILSEESLKSFHDPHEKKEPDA